MRTTAADMFNSFTTARTGGGGSSGGGGGDLASTLNPTHSSGSAASAAFGHEHLTKKFNFSDLSGMEKLLSYKTVKFQVVEDPLLALLHRGVQLLVLLYAVEQIMYTHSFEKLGNPTGATNIYAAEDFAHYTPDDDLALCPATAAGPDKPATPSHPVPGLLPAAGARPSTIPTYVCQKGWVFADIKCKVGSCSTSTEAASCSCRRHKLVAHTSPVQDFWAYEIFAKGAPMAPTPDQFFVTTFQQEARVAVGGSPGSNSSAKGNFVPPGLGSSQIVIDSTFSLPEGMEGLLETSKSTEGEHNNALSTATLSVTVLDSKGNKAHEFDAKDDFVLTVDELIKLAGLDINNQPLTLDSPNPAAANECSDANTTASYRQTGMKLELRLRLSNRESGFSTLWSHLMGESRFQVEASIRRVLQPWVSTGPAITNTVRGETMVVTRYGLQLLVIPSGEVGERDGKTTVTSLTSFMVLMM